MCAHVTCLILPVLLLALLTLDLLECFWHAAVLMMRVSARRKMTALNYDWQKRGKGEKVLGFGFV